MEKRIYLIRHCQAKGQPPESPLTEVGFKQAEELAEFLSHIHVDRIISSPFSRAIQTIEPFAKKVNLAVEIDNRLSERVLGSESFPDWMDKLKATFDDMELTYVGGESSKEAMMRIVAVVNDFVKSDAESTIIVTHGNLMSLLIHHYNQDFGFEQWGRLRNPDVFLLHILENEFRIEHMAK